jgi:hypothetical protein
LRHRLSAARQPGQPVRGDTNPGRAGAAGSDRGKGHLEKHRAENGRSAKDARRLKAPASRRRTCTLQCVPASARATASTDRDSVGTDCVQRFASPQSRVRDLRLRGRACSIRAGWTSRCRPAELDRYGARMTNFYGDQVTADGWPLHQFRQRC